MNPCARLITRLAMAALLLATTLCACAAKNEGNDKNRTGEQSRVIVGAERTDIYVPLLKGKRIALLSNQTGLVGNRHTLDVMLEHGLNVTTIFSPEHGFRGKADAGEHVSSSVDEKTGIPIASLYDGKKRTPSAETLARFDVIVTDIQDVGLRFYTYYVTMVDLMDVAAANGKEFVVFDRPNPNIMTVDGPILDMSLRSGVGRLPIPTVYGMTMGELAKMVVGEGWLKDGRKVPLTVVPCGNYTRHTRYRLPVAPSPNLPNMLSIYLYPSMCYFEGTTVSLGRGTEWPFQVYGHPDMTRRAFSFTPESRDGAKNPPQLGNLCHGEDLHNMTEEQAIAEGVNLEYVIDAYHDLTRQGKQFYLNNANFFDKLMGNKDIRRMIDEGYSAKQIRTSWQADVDSFRILRKPYLIYPE